MATKMKNEPVATRNIKIRKTIRTQRMEYAILREKVSWKINQTCVCEREEGVANVRWVFLVSFLAYLAPCFLTLPLSQITRPLKSCSISGSKNKVLPNIKFQILLHQIKVLHELFNMVQKNLKNDVQKYFIF